MNKKSLFLLLTVGLVGLCQVQFLQAMKAVHEFVEHVSGDSVGQDQAALERQKHQQQQQQGQERLQEQQHEHEGVDVLRMLKNKVLKIRGDRGSSLPVDTVSSDQGDSGSGKGSQQGFISDGLGIDSMAPKDREAIEKLAQGDHILFEQKTRKQQKSAKQLDKKFVEQRIELVKVFRKELLESLGKDFFRKLELLKTSPEYRTINEKINEFYVDFKDAHDEKSIDALRRKMNEILDQIRGKKAIVLELYEIAQKNAQGKLGLFKRIFTTAVPTAEAVKTVGKQVEESRQNKIDEEAKTAEGLEKLHSTTLTGIRDIETRQRMIQAELDGKPSFFRRSPEKEYKELRDQLAKDKEKLKLVKAVIETSPHFNLGAATELPEKPFKSGGKVQANTGQVVTLKSDFSIVISGRDEKEASNHSQFYDDLVKKFETDQKFVSGGLYVRQELLDQINAKLKQLEKPESLTEKGKLKEVDRLKEEIQTLAEEAKEQFLTDKGNGVRFARYEQPLKEGNVPAEMVFMKNPDDGENDSQWGFYTNRLDQYTTETLRPFYKKINEHFQTVVKTSTEINYVIDIISDSKIDQYLSREERSEISKFFDIVEKINKKLESMSQPGMTQESIEKITKSIYSDINSMNTSLILTAAMAGTTF